MFKNVNQVTLPSGGALIIFGVLLAIISNLGGDIDINPQWVSICIVGGFGLVLVSINALLTRIAGLALVAIALIVLGFALT